VSLGSLNLRRSEQAQEEGDHRVRPGQRSLLQPLTMPMNWKPEISVMSPFTVQQLR
jgi:hypothetical protein